MSLPESRPANFPAGGVGAGENAAPIHAPSVNGGGDSHSQSDSSRLPLALPAGRYSSEYSSSQYNVESSSGYVSV